MSTRFLSLDELTHMPKPAWLIEGLFEAQSLVMLAAPSYNWKSFLVLDWLLCMASGRPWNGKHVIPSRVLYALGEGKASLLKRIGAWLDFHKLNPEELAQLHNNFRVTFDVPQLAMKPSVDNMLMQLSEDGFTPQVLAIDTFARSFVGLDENSQRDTGMWIESAERLRANGMTVIFLHHTKRNTEFGVQYRGSSTIMAAVDTALTMVRDMASNEAKLSVTKQKDHDEGKPLMLRRQLVGDQQEGSMVLVPFQPIDERFTPENIAMEAFLKKVLADPTYDNDRGRARDIAQQFNITEGAAAVKISRFKKLSS